MPYNKLNISDVSNRITLEIPVFQDNVFDITTEQILAASRGDRNFGSCAFELADLLKLLPGQSRSHQLETRVSSLQDLFTDDETYYCRCPRDSTLRLITQHFVSIQEAPGRLYIQTDIGLFTIIRTDRRLLLRVNQNERATDVKAPRNQDYDSLKKCAAGLWRLREGDRID